MVTSATEVEPSSAVTEADPAPTQWRRLVDHGWWLGPPVLMALLGAVALLRDHGLWFDELYTAEMARVPIGRLVSAVVEGEGTIPYLRDAPPSYNGPYYAVVHLWTAVTGLEPGEVGLRLLSLTSAAAAVAVLARAAGRLAGRWVGVVCGLAVAANPFVVEYAVEARGYALALLCVALAVLGLARWLDGRARSLVLFGGASAAAGLLHWFALLVPLALAVAAYYLRRRRALTVLAAAAVATLPAAAVLAVAVVNGVGDSGAEWIGGVGFEVPRLFLESWTARSGALLAGTAVAVVCAAVTRRAKSAEAAAVAVCWVALPVVVVTAVELVRPVYVDRYLLPSAVGIALIAALGTRGLPHAPGVALATALVAASLGATFTALDRPPKDDIRSAVDALARLHRPGEPVVAAARWDALGVDHYVRVRHPRLRSDVFLPPAAPPAADTVWVVRRGRGGIKGDELRLDALDRHLAGRGMAVAGESRFDGRYADVIVQRWTPSASP